MGSGKADFADLVRRTVDEKPMRTRTHATPGPLKLPTHAAVRLIELETAIECARSPRAARLVLDSISTLKASPRTRRMLCARLRQGGAGGAGRRARRSARGARLPTGRGGACWQENPQAEDHLQPGRLMRNMPVLMQLLLLLQCLYQGLILTMLGRDAIIDFGAPLGVLFIGLMFLPTKLVSLFLTPHVLKNVATTGAVIEADHDVLSVLSQACRTPRACKGSRAAAHGHAQPTPLRRGGGGGRSLNTILTTPPPRRRSS